MNSKNTSILLITAFILSAFLFIFIMTAVAGNKSSGSDDIEKVENNLIIDGLKQNSEKPLEEGDIENQKGAIIYDDTFDDNIAKAESTDSDSEKAARGGHHRAKRPAVSVEAKPAKIMDRLSLKDKRWHLTAHKISGGENLWDISRRYNTDYRLIIKINDIRNPDRLREGNTILIPNRNGVEYRVKAGDSLYGIARAYGVDMKKISEHNKIGRNKIKAGQAIFIPDARNARENENGEAPARKVCSKNEKNIAGGRYKFLWPLRGRLTSAFGSRISPISNLRRFHCGIDISASEGTPVRASLGGRVIFSGWKDGYGWLVILKHERGYITVYAHNLKNLTSEGDSVYAGKVIALSGSSGAVTGPHLHFELRKYLTPLNPVRFLN